MGRAGVFGGQLGLDPGGVIPVSIPWRLGAFAIPDSAWTPPLSAESLGLKPGQLGLSHSPKGAGGKGAEVWRSSENHDFKLQDSRSDSSGAQLLPTPRPNTGALAPTPRPLSLSRDPDREAIFSGTWTSSDAGVQASLTLPGTPGPPPSDPGVQVPLPPRAQRSRPQSLFSRPRSPRIPSSPRLGAPIPAGSSWPDSSLLLT